ncbi:hypothetical protein TWF679_010488 [Orbilia oligospora]|uniref:Uncharacterized protein n=1 Tax=Orbilia oligospora TaxID=2813651 RepID=A0A8H8V0D7_ORBOL|nr:hypothetical protein TWF679_010488 [Orbilia oligospora]
MMAYSSPLGGLVLFAGAEAERDWDERTREPHRTDHHVRLRNCKIKKFREDISLRSPEGLCPRTQRIKYPQEAYGVDLAGLVSWPLAINQTPQSHGLHEHTKASNLDMIQDELQFRWLSPVGLRPNPKSAAQKVPRGSLLVENSPDDQGNTSSLCCGTSIDTKYATRLLMGLKIMKPPPAECEQGA